MPLLRRTVAVLVAVVLAAGVAIGGSLLEHAHADAAPLLKTRTALSSSGSPSAVGATVTFTAVVQRKGFLTPDPTSGTVTFFDGPNVMGTGTVGANHAATFATTWLTPGSHSILAKYEGTASLRSSWGGPVIQVVEAPIATTTSLGSDLTPAQLTQSVTLTATVSAPSGTPEGIVAFEAGGTNVAGCDAQPLGGGIATCVTSALPIGSHDIIAVYSGSSGHAASTSPAFEQVVTALATTTSLSADVNPSTFGDVVTYTAVVAAPAGSSPTDGTVTFRDGVDVIGSASLDSSAVASITISTLGAGSHSISAEFAGNASHAASTSTPLDQQVGRMATTTSVALSPNPSSFGTSVTFTAHVTPDPSAGSVQFTIDGADFGAPVALGAGGTVVSDASSDLPVGDHTIAAAYSGSENYEASSDSTTQSVGRAETSTVLDADVNPSVYGETVTFTVTVTPEPATGSVQLSIDGAPVGGSVALTAGTASLVGTGLTPGVHVIRAAFLGTANSKPSTGALSQTIFKVPSSTGLSIAPATPIAGAPLVLKATVSGSLSGSNPTGTIIFSVDGSPVGSPVSLTGAGVASMTMPAPPAGAHTAAAEYSGDPEYAPSNASGSTVVTPLVKSGYWMVGLSGSVYAFGDVPYKGGADTGNVVDIEPTRSGEGYWVATSLGGVLRFGDAPNFGDARDRLRAGERVVSMSATPSNDGYWMFTDIGRVIPFGAAPHLGDMSAVKLNGAVLGSVATPTGHGYYMVASDGGVFSFGDAVFHGSMGSTRLNQPVVGLVPDADNVGYWLVARDGGVFAFAAPFHGSMGGSRLNRPVIGMVGFGIGYLMVAEDGGIFNYSDKPFHGSLGANPPAAPIVSVAAHAEP